VAEAFVLDTHTLILYASGNSRRLGKRARAALASFEAGEVVLWVPSPVLTEVWLLSRSGAIRCDPSFRAWWHQVQRAELIFVETQLEDVMTAAELEWNHDDFFDRLIVAISLRLDAPLLTRDDAIHDWGGVEVRW
jgi:PIN domain nuclease of toxin-antitoxin system